MTQPAAATATSGATADRGQDARRRNGAGRSSIAEGRIEDAPAMIADVTAATGAPIPSAMPATAASSREPERRRRQPRPEERDAGGAHDRDATRS